MDRRLPESAKADIVQQAKPIVPPLWRISMTIVLLGGLSPVGASMIGLQFLPSAEWISSFKTWAVLLGLTVAVLLPRVIWRNYASMPVGEVRRVIALFASPFLGFWVALNLVLVGVPMSFAVVAGGETQLSFVVLRSDERGLSGCRSPIELRDLPFMFNSLCRIAPEFKSRFSPGDPIRVVGRGTKYGVFVKRIRNPG